MQRAGAGPLKPIALVGLPGCGKSSIGKQLSRRLALELVDTDRLVEARIGCSIRDYFELEGEARFREHEAAALVDAVNSTAGVIATGGGIVLREDNRSVLCHSTRCIYIAAAPESLATRLRNDQRRPLMQGVDPLVRLNELFSVRDPLYREAAHAVIDTRGSNMSTLVDRIVAALSV